jgi:uncharacterized membrane protein YphA (DoxX/SURF4 family)
MERRADHERRGGEGEKPRLEVIRGGRDGGAERGEAEDARQDGASAPRQGERAERSGGDQGVERGLRAHAVQSLQAALRSTGPRTRLGLVVRVVAGVIFLVFGAGKFVDHASELASIREYGLPFPEITVVAIGVLEIAGGALLLARRLVRPAAFALAADMVGAIVVSGIARGEDISLTLAPALLLGMLYVLCRHRVENP